jgi:hypothetical protein
MHLSRVTRETWRERAKAVGLTNKAVAIGTKTSIHSVNAYAAQKRRPDDIWVASVARLIECIESGETRS